MNFSVVRKAVILSLLSGLTVANNSPSESCGASCAADDTSLLQQRSKLGGAKRVDTEGAAPTPAPTPAPRGPKSSIAFAGGGFLSWADFTAATSGLLGVLQRKKPGSTLTDLMKRFDIVAGTSGGTWFYNSLVYSKSFQELVENMAAFPGHSGILYNAQLVVRWLAYWKPQATGHVLIDCLALKKDATTFNWTQFLDENNASLDGDASSSASLAQASTESQNKNEEWTATLNGLDDQLDALPEGLNQERQQGKENVLRLRDLPFPDMMASIKGPLGKMLPPEMGEEYSDFFYELMVTTGGMHWLDAVKHLFQSGPQIGFSTPLGTSHYNEWAEGKISILASTAITPPGPDAFWTVPGKVPQKVTYYKEKGRNLTYAAEDPADPGNFVQPVRFSVVIGDGEDQDSVMPFCTSTMCQTYKPQYTFDGEVLEGANQTLAEIFHEAFEVKAGKIPISHASAASSAAAGVFNLQYPVANQNCLELAVWMSGEGNGNSIDAANNRRNIDFEAPELYESYAKTVAKDSLMPLVDGGFSDDLAVANSVAAGATEVLSWQDNTDYTNRTGNSMKTNHLNLALLFKGSPQTGAVIFESPSSQEVVEAYNNFASIMAPANSTFLKRIVWGSIEAVTTQNDFFGIEAGRSVTVNVFAPETWNITMGTPTAGFESFFDYGNLTREIVMTLMTSEQTETILEKFF